jgi:nitrite reductase/ring-hydroxylating ferredoxin subunit
MAWYKVSNMLDDGQPYIRKVVVGGKTLCLIRYEEQLYALSNHCPHAGADLSKGWCDQGKLVCPYHRYTYHLESGKGSVGQNDFVNTYRVDAREDGIYIEVLSFWERVTQAVK